MLYSKRKRHWVASCTSSPYFAIIKLDILGPRFRHQDNYFFPERRFPLFSLYHPQPHTSNYHLSEKVVEASPLEEVMDKRLSREFCNLLTYPRKTKMASRT